LHILLTNYTKDDKKIQKKLFYGNFGEVDTFYWSVPNPTNTNPPQVSISILTFTLLMFSPLHFKFLVDYSKVFLGKLSKPLHSTHHTSSIANLTICSYYGIKMIRNRVKWMQNRG